MTQSDFLAQVMPFKDKLFRLAKRLLISTEEAQDATQEMVLKLWKNKEKIQSYKSVEAFAMTMTKNYCYDRLKSKQAQNLKIVHNNYKDESIGLQKQIEVNDSLQWVSKIMDNLPEQQRLVVQLRDIEQYEFTEIAKILDMKEATVRVTLSRARKEIQKQLIKTHHYGVQ